MSEENDQADSDTPGEDEERPDAESRADIAAAVEYGERYEACQVTARKVRAARDLIELAGGYKDAIVMADAVWFAASDSDDATNGASEAAEDDAEVEYRADFEGWEVRTRKVMAAEKLLKLSGYDEAFMLLDTIIVVQQGQQGHKQVAKVRGAAGGYHKRAAAALEEKEGE